MTAKVLEFIKDGSNARIRVLFDKLPSKPIAPGQMDEVELHKVCNITGLEVTFESYNIGEKMLQVGVSYEFRSWWVLRELKIAQSDASTWRKEEFRTSNAVEFIKDGHRVRRKQEGDEHPEGAKIVPEGWEHEHCRLCWETISPFGGDERTGYTDGSEWVCESCFEKYIASGFGKKLG